MTATAGNTFTPEWQPARYCHSSHPGWDTYGFTRYVRVPGQPGLIYQQWAYSTSGAKTLFMPAPPSAGWYYLGASPGGTIEGGPFKTAVDAMNANETRLDEAMKETP